MSTSNPKPLTGGCSCGRNKYTISIPANATETARILFDNGHAHRRTTASPLTTLLRIPLPWLHTTTYSYNPDETHSSIRRTYTSPSEPNTIRQFCGYCGTQLSFWTEEPVERREWIDLMVGSLDGEDLRELEDLVGLDLGEGLVGGNGEGGLIEGGEGESEGVPWFEGLVEGSRLGRVTRRGERREGRGWKVEWEIVEWTEDGDEEMKEAESEKGTAGKRKLGEVVGDDTGMEGAH